jgi:hypothetical protein
MHGRDENCVQIVIDLEGKRLHEEILTCGGREDRPNVKTKLKFIWFRTGLSGMLL